MTFLTFSSIFLAFFGVAFCLDPELAGLKQVHLVWRHGDRTPISPYPNDPYKDYQWPGGLGQLTKRGMRRHLELGRWLRQRYTDWLSPTYDRAEVVIRSTDVDRTLMSALSNLAGLFPPQGDQVWDEELPWQPIPVHTVPQDEDYLLSSHAHCPRFAELQKEIESGDWMREIYAKNRDLFEYISLNTGENITNIVKLDYIYDSLLIESEFNLTLPSWTDQVFSVKNGTFKDLRDLSFTVDTLTEELKRLKGGPLVKEMIQHFDTIATSKDTSNQMKLYIYSGHDTTVAPILHTLGVFNGLAPPYASAILVELLDTNGLHVKISYRNDSSSSAFPLTIPGCNHLCPLEKFKVLTKKIIPGDILGECGVGSEEDAHDKTVQRVTLIAAVCSSVMAATVLIVTLGSVCRGGKNKDEEYDFPRASYQPVNTNDME